MTALPSNISRVRLPAPVDYADDLARAAVDLKQTVSVLSVDEALVVLILIIIIPIVVATGLFGLSGRQAAIVLLG